MVHPILSKETFSIPPLGMLVFHPGVTPEYRGPHSAFWATMNNEFWGIGWSLLRIDEGIDTGQVLAQEKLHLGRPDHREPRDDAAQFSRRWDQRRGQGLAPTRTRRTAAS
jgi:methionyl-tRNA formyltransferase